MKFFRLTYFLLWILIFHLSSPIHHHHSRRHHLHHLYQQGCPLLSAGFQVTAIQHYVEHTLHSKQSKNVKTGDFPAAPQVGSPRREKNFDTAPFSTIYKVQIPKDFYKSLNGLQHICQISVSKQIGHSGITKDMCYRTRSQKHSLSMIDIVINKALTYIHSTF